MHAASVERPRQMTAVVRADNRTGKLVRSVVVTPRTVAEKVVLATPPPSAEPKPVEAPATIAEISEATGVSELVERLAKQNRIPAELIHSVIRVESNYNPNALSNKGAMGMMQLIPATAKRFGVGNAFNPKQNVEGGVKYLKYLLEMFNGNYPLALAAYNAGEGAVVKYGGIPPYTETRNYVQAVHANWKKLNSEKPKFAALVPAAKPKDAGEPNSIKEVVNPDGSVRYVTSQ